MPIATPGANQPSINQWVRNPFEVLPPWPRARMLTECDLLLRHADAHGRVQCRRANSLATHTFVNTHAHQNPKIGTSRRRFATPRGGTGAHRGAGAVESRPRRARRPWRPACGPHARPQRGRRRHRGQQTCFHPLDKVWIRFGLASFDPILPSFVPSIDRCWLELRSTVVVLEHFEGRGTRVHFIQQTNWHRVV